MTNRVTRRVWFAALTVALLVLLSACRVDTTVTVVVRDDGSGVVRLRIDLDAAAVRSAETGGGKLEDRILLSDLSEAGWRVSAWARPRARGGASLTVSKPFARAEDAGAVVAELVGEGPLRRVTVGRERSTFRTEWSFSGVADLAEIRTPLIEDEELVQRLQALGVDVAGIDNTLGARMNDAYRLTVVAELPHASARTWHAADGKRTVMRTTSEAADFGRLVLLAIGVALGVIAVVLFVAGELRRRRRRRRLARRRSAPLSTPPLP